MVVFFAGLSPMGDFLQERALQQKKAGREVAKLQLFFGCRSPHLGGWAQIFAGQNGVLPPHDGDEHFEGQLNGGP
ncbi:hypothetical protein L226DRAFT_574966 [Lentinus tigrinus ALCF2SS1-7]|uniref:uncharacterized protein n=1 Tax=Lentinus tigrinus ALCF2SS1-7 TaxID=1328758 RepID=UPI00116604FD|nr:hypothetical protein L226DRAFT_574966 [Lentinus tigrinus ALCF2SS1-7]